MKPSIFERVEEPIPVRLFSRDLVLIRAALRYYSLYEAPEAVQDELAALETFLRSVK